ncbi:hypothetical protein L798_08370 [Zootermopsis nevadensis]|uniref:Uncharacterized protein n=1 Tax=Zootermopsis nevadensis TaxID=136037 RepID=A0A067RF89_ZOONE|nr:hypothetical protein L798_08370 [Zootermopsis nevadensis]
MNQPFIQSTICQSSQLYIHVGIHPSEQSSSQPSANPVVCLPIQTCFHALIHLTVCQRNQLSVQSPSTHRIAGDGARGESTRGRKTARVVVMQVVLACRGLLLLHRGVGVADHVERGASRHTRLKRRLHRHRRRVPHVARRVLVVRVYALVFVSRLPPCHAPVAHPCPRQRPRLLRYKSNNNDNG